MADARYVIDLILNARDNTSRALESASRGMEVFREESEKTSRKMDDTSRNFQKLEESAKRVSAEQVRLGQSTSGIAQAQVELEKATRKLAQAEADTTRTARESAAVRASALRDVRRAHTEYIDVLTREGQVEEANAKRKATSLQNSRLAVERTREEIRVTTQLRNAREALGKTFDPVRIKQYEDAIKSSGKALKDLGGDIKDIGRIQKEAFDSARVERFNMAQSKTLEITRKYLSQIERIGKIEEDRQHRAAQGMGLTGPARTTQELDLREARVKATQFAAELQGLIGHLEANVDFDADPASVAQMMALREMIGKDLHLDVKLDAAGAIAQAAATRAALQAIGKDADGQKGLVGGLFSAMQDGFRDSTGQIAAFDNLIRGAFTLAIAVFLPALVNIAGAAAGALTALASSAIYAGGALGGALTAGAAQAIPVLGVLAATVSKVKGVFEAVQQSNLLREQQSYQGAAAAKREADTTDQVANAVDGLTNANETLTQAHERVREAQRNVTEARKEARRELEDLILAEREAALSSQDAQKALDRAVSEGRVDDIDRLQLQVDRTELERQRSRADSIEGQVGGVDQVAGVRNAEQQLKTARRGIVDAERSVERAARGLERAQRSAVTAEAGITAAGGKLAYMLANMSAAERRLFQAVTRLQEAWKKASEVVAGPMIDAFTYMVNRVTSIIQQPALINAMRGLSTSMARQMRLFFDAFTDNRAMRQWNFFIAEASKNMVPLGATARSVARAFMNIGELAAPTLNKMLVSIQRITREFELFTASGSGQNTIKQFFDLGLQSAGSFMRLLGSIARLFLAIAGPGGGARAGVGIMRSWTDQINKWADAINTRGSGAQRFFLRFFTLTRQILKDLAPIFAALGKEFEKTFTQDGRSAVQGFTSLMVQVLIPATGKLIRGIGDVVAEVGKFADEHPRLMRIVAALAAAATGFALFTKLGAFFRPLTAVIGAVGTALAGVAARAGFVGSRFALMVRGALIFGKSAGPIGLVTTAIIWLLNKLGLLDDVWNGLKGAFNAFIKGIGPGVKDLMKSIGELADAFGGTRGLAPILRFVFGVLIRNAIATIKLLAGALGNILGGGLKIAAGVLRLFAALLTLNMDKAKSAAKSIVSGFADIGKGILKGVLAPLGLLGQAIVNAFRRAWNAVKEFLGIASASKRFKDIGESILDGIKEGISGIGRAITAPWRIAIKGIRDGWNDLKEYFRKNSFGDVWRKTWSGFKDMFKDSVNWVIDRWNKLGFKFKVPAPINREISIDTPNIRRLAAGGSVGTGYGGGDRVPILAEEGEYVVRKEAVSKVGLSLMNMINALGGGGGRIGGRFFQTGGEVKSSKNRDQKADRGFDMEAMVEAIEDAGQKAVQAWDQTWQKLRTTTKEGADYLGSTVLSTLTRIVTGFRSRGAQMVASIGRSMNQVKSAIFSGMSYVSKTVNDSLKAFGVSPVKLSVERPDANKDEQRAGGGFIGNQGERGRDLVPAWLGRGEAVLNWAHQKVVDPAMRAYYGYGLPEMFASNRATHAGAGRAGGFAQGGIVPIPWQPGEEVAASVLPLLTKLQKKYRFVVTDAFDRDRSAGHRSPGHNVTGTAVDISAGGGGWGAVDSLAAWAVKQGFTVYYDGRFGTTDLPPHGRGHHVHIEFGSNPKGMVADVPELKDLKVLGTEGPLKDLVESALKKVTGAARAYIAKMMPDAIDGDAGYFSVEKGSVAETIYRVWDQMNLPFKALVSAIETGIVESNLRNVNYGDADSVGWRQERSHYGSIAERMNVAHGAVRFFNEWRQFADPGESPGEIAAQVQRPRADLRGKYDAVAGQALRVIEQVKGSISAEEKGDVQEFATGGVVRGFGPQPAIVHGGEVVLNEQMQSVFGKILRMANGGFAGDEPTSTDTGDGATAGKIGPTGALYEMWKKAFAAKTFKNFNELMRALGKAVETATDFSQLLSVAQSVGSTISTWRNSNNEKMAIRVEKLTEMLNSLGARILSVISLLTDEQLGEVRELVEGQIASMRKGGIKGKEISAMNTARRVLGQLRGEQEGRAILGDMREKTGELVSGIYPLDATLNTWDAFISGAKKIASMGKRAAAKLPGISQSIDAGVTAIVGEGGLLEKMGTVFDTFSTHASNAIKMATYSITAIGGVIRNLSPTEVAQREIDLMRKQADMNQDRLALAEAAEVEAEKILREAQAGGKEEDIAKAQAGLQSARDKILELETVVADGTIALAEALMAQIQAAFDKVIDDAQRVMTGFDLQDRLADVRSGFGDPVGAAKMRGSILAGRGDAMQAELDKLQGVLDRAEAAGNDELAQQIRDRMAELKVALQENELAIRDNIVAIHQAKLDLITERRDFRTGIFDGIRTLLDKVGQISGTTNIALQRQVLEQSRAELERSGNKFATFLNKWFDTDLRGLHGEALAAEMAGLDFKRAEKGMTTAEKEQFHAMVSGLLDNENALLDNTIALRELSGEMKEQNFATTAWQWYRNAIFTGSGGLLPEFQVPAMQTGGYVTKTGLFGLHAGEAVIPSREVAGSGGVQVNIDHPVQVADPVYLGERIAWKLKHTRR